MASIQSLFSSDGLLPGFGTQKNVPRIRLLSSQWTTDSNHSTGLRPGAPPTSSQVKTNFPFPFGLCGLSEAEAGVLSARLIPSAAPAVAEEIDPKNFRRLMDSVSCRIVLSFSSLATVCLADTGRRQAGG